MNDSTQGYEQEAPELLRRYEFYPFTDSHQSVLYLLPQAPADVLDIGAGTGRDAAYFADQGHRVVAIEPTAALRNGAIALHPSPRITWIDDRLPSLSATPKRTYDLVWLSAVWMHFDTQERAENMGVIAPMIRSGGALMMTLRHGPIPAGRRMFAVTSEETVALAKDFGLSCTLTAIEGSRGEANAKGGVTWARLWFVKD